MKTRFVVSLACLTLLGTSSGSAQTKNTVGPRYSITDLGNLAGGSDSYGKAINNRGEIAGFDFLPFDNGQTSAAVAVLYRDHSMQELGNIGGYASAAFAINDHGRITGRAATSADPYSASSYHAFSYDGTMHDLGTLGGSMSIGYGINNRGSIVGTSTLNSDGYVFHAFLYDGSMHDLGTMDGLPGTIAQGINDKGQIVGYAYDSNPTTIPPINEAFLYDGTFHALGTLGGLTSYAYAINNEGVVVGQSETSSGENHAFLYDGTMHDLGALNTYTAYALGINRRRQVVGLFAYGAFLYEDGTMYDLNQLLDASGDEWQFLIEATSINDCSVIVGTGSKPDGLHAFRMDPKVHCEPDDRRQEHGSSNPDRGN